MRDLLFSGVSVEDAVAAAGQALGMAPAGLRYVVLAQAAPGRLGGAPTPAQIAVLLDRPAPPQRAEGAPPPTHRRRTPADLVGLLKEVAGLDMGSTVQEDEAGTRLRLTGPAAAFFLEGEAAVFQALDHLLQRVSLQQTQSRFTLTCEGYREWRDEALRKRALELAQEVLLDGESRSTGPLNSYERRIVHLAVESVPGVETYSVGEGGERRVTVARVGEAAAPDPPASAEP